MKIKAKIGLARLVSASVSARIERSFLVVMFVAALAVFQLSTLYASYGIDRSLNVGMVRLGADILVVPEGRQLDIKGALVTGKPVFGAFMPKQNLERVAHVEGVALSSPQVYLQSLGGAACCAFWELFMIAFDPETDFVITPWLRERRTSPLGVGDAIGGDFVSDDPLGSGKLLIYGYQLNLVGKLEETGMGLDQTLFFTFDTAREMAKASLTTAAEPMIFPEDRISVVAVKVRPGYRIEDVASRIKEVTPGVATIVSSEIVRDIYNQTKGLFHMLYLASGIVWLLTMVFTGLLLSLVVNERRREIGMLRAVGATRKFIFKLFLAEGSCLALVGGIIGVIVAIAFFHLFQRWLMTSFSTPLLAPSLPILVGSAIGCVLITMVALLPSLLYPAIRAAQTDPALAMRQEAL